MRHCVLAITALLAGGISLGLMDDQGRDDVARSAVVNSNENAGAASAVNQDAAQPPERRVLPPQPGAPGCLPEPMHFTSTPDLAVGVELVLSRYLRFTTASGEVIHARMFLLEIRPDRTRFPDSVPEEVRQRRQAVPGRMSAIGHQITVDDPSRFQPDFDVPANYVKSAGPCAYEVDLGSLKCLVRVAERKST